MVHLGRLEALEYVVVHRAKRGLGVAYELAYVGESLPAAVYDAEVAGGLSGARRVDDGGESAACRAAESERSARADGALVDGARVRGESTGPQARANGASYA